MGSDEFSAYVPKSWYQNVGEAGLSSGGSGKNLLPRLIQVVSRIQFLMFVYWPGCLSAPKDHSLVLASSKLATAY